MSSVLTIIALVIIAAAFLTCGLTQRVVAICGVAFAVFIWGALSGSDI